MHIDKRFIYYLGSDDWNRGILWVLVVIPVICLILALLFRYRRRRTVIPVNTNNTYYNTQPPSYEQNFPNSYNAPPMAENGYYGPSNGPNAYNSGYIPQERPVVTDEFQPPPGPPQAYTKN